MAMTEKIRIALIKRNMPVTELAKRLNTSSQNLSAKFRRDNFSERELVEIAEALNCDFQATFVDKETGQPLS